MMSAQHTPGPWLTCPATEFDKMMGVPTGHAGMTAVYVPPGRCPGHPADSDEWPQLIAYADDWRGDGRLIAAAPEMFIALLDCVCVMEAELRGLECIQPELRQAKAALRKAGG